MKIGPALDLVEEGKVVRRAAWPAGTTLRLGLPRRYFVVTHAHSDFPTPWHATSPDLRAGDWEEVPS